MQGSLVTELKEENLYLKSEVERLNGIVLLPKRGKFGSKAESYTGIPEQLIFNEIEREAGTLPDYSGETETITYERKRGRGEKNPFPDDLPREERIIDLPEEEKTCPHDGHRLQEIGEERTEKFKTVPAQMSVVVEIKKKYACRFCESHVAQAKSKSILPGTIATPELLTGGEETDDGI